MERRYGIKQFEKVTGISAHTLRFFDKIGLLSPARSDNGYRVYTLEQVSQAETITLLQKALFSNAEIGEILNDYASPSTLQRLKDNRVKLHKEQIRIRRVLAALDQHIAYLGELGELRARLYAPFVEELAPRQVGAIRLSSLDIVDFFDAGDVIMKDPAWPHFRKHGFLLDRLRITPQGYPLEIMYVDDRRVARQAPITLAGGPYLCMYADGSLENNTRVHALIERALADGCALGDAVIIEQVSGPVVEKRKSDYLVRIMLPLAANASTTAPG
jgi:DNA-binding transcriptional MerR regulator